MKKLCRFTVFTIFALASATAGAAPVGYSVNSDEPLGDSLYRIDLATGAETLIGKVLSLGVGRTDIEGLAFDTAGTLWAVDDESRMLFPVDPGTGLVESASEVSITGLGAASGNDFGLTFTCSGKLYLTSVESQSLYSLGLDGTASLIGAAGSLGVRISAIAAYGNPARLYGLGNGLISDGGPKDNRSLYEIDTGDGTVTLIGEIGAQAADYFEAGLSFDDSGTLWAITDRRTIAQNLGSEVLRLDTGTGEAALVSTTTVAGFESLAVAPPAGCSPDNGEDSYLPVPVFGPAGALLAILALLATGILALPRHRA